MAIQLEKQKAENDAKQLERNRELVLKVIVSFLGIVCQNAVLLSLLTVRSIHILYTLDSASNYYAICSVLISIGNTSISIFIITILF